MALTGYFRFTFGSREHRAPPDWLYAIRAKKGEKPPGQCVKQARGAHPQIKALLHHCRVRVKESVLGPRGFGAQPRLLLVRTRISGYGARRTDSNRGRGPSRKFEPGLFWIHQSTAASAGVAKRAMLSEWRRERDSNPRYRC